MTGRVSSSRTAPGRGRQADPMLLATVPVATPAIARSTEASDTMEAWERFLTGDGSVVVPSRNFVVASWLRSRQLGINPTGRSAPIVAAGGAMELLRARNAELLAAAAGVFAQLGEMFSGSRSMMLLTNPEGVILDVVGDPHTLDQGQDIHLKPGGDWREDTVGTNGIGTAIATGRPAQVHASEHFCEGIKAWTCAASPIFEPGTGAMLGVIDISGPPATYQRNNLSLAVSTARQIEMALADRAMNERMHLLEICLDRVSAADVAGMVAIDRRGRLVHSTGRVPSMVPIGQRVPGLDDGCAVEAWADRLPDGLRPEWFSPVRFDGRSIGALLVVPAHVRAGAREAATAAGAAAADAAFNRIIGRSAVMLETVARARKLVGKQVPVLIHGETGVGKELFARAIHGEITERRPFVVFNCGAVARDLMAGELFGHVRGAFTGATSDGRPGRFELAHGGTLCLDEIGELPLELQPFLLRALEEGVIYRLGEGTPRPVNVPAAVADQPRPAGRGRSRPVPQGPVLSHRRHHGAATAAARAYRRHHGADRALQQDPVRPARRADAPVRTRGDAADRGLSLAWQRPRVAQHGRKPVADGRGSRCRGRRTDDGDRTGAARRHHGCCRSKPGNGGTCRHCCSHTRQQWQPCRRGSAARRFEEHVVQENG